MTLYLARRIGQMAVTLFILSVMVFGLARLTGDPAPMVLSTEATKSDLEFFRRQYGLDRTLPEQYLVFVGNVARADFGLSFRYRQPALGIVLSGLGPTLKLSSIAMIIAIALGLSLGILAAASGSALVDRAASLYASFGQAMPSFWLGLMLISTFSVALPLFPSSGYGTAAHYVLPVTTLAIFASASIARLTQANMREALRTDFVHMERILGISERSVVLRHALRNAAIPIVTYLGLQFGLLVGGAIVTERVFAWPGLGQVIVDAILHRDFPVIQAAVLITAMMFMLVNLAVDVICRLLDPRLLA
jgi:peptide/nickel transport system permease protein